MPVGVHDVPPLLVVHSVDGVSFTCTPASAMTLPRPGNAATSCTLFGRFEVTSTQEAAKAAEVEVAEARQKAAARSFTGTPFVRGRAGRMSRSGGEYTRERGGFLRL